MVTCPKCGYVRKPSDTAPEWQCPNCQIAYAKFGTAPVAHPAAEPPPSVSQPNPKKYLQAVFLHFVAGVIGTSIWFGVQAVSRLDNFSDQGNAYYFIFYYGAACMLGVAARYGATSVGVVLVISQAVSYLLYPNVHRQLGNLYPIALALLIGFTAPAVILVKSVSAQIEKGDEGIWGPVRGFAYVGVTVAAIVGATLALLAYPHGLSGLF